MVCIHLKIKCIIFILLLGKFHVSLIVYYFQNLKIKHKIKK